MRYGTSNNHPIVVREAFPRVTVFPSQMPGLVLREDDVRRHPDRYRSGYHHYYRDWRDDYFYYPHYVFQPYRDCVISPWYYYPQLPGYLSGMRISFGHPRITIFSWTRYTPFQNYGSDVRYYYNQSDRGDRDLDYAVRDLQDSFERFDRRAIGQMVPRNGRVSVYLDQRYAYDLGADDFYDMLIDAVTSNDTRRYEILAVERSGDRARVQARHLYLDPSGREASVYHTYELERDRSGFVIRAFGIGNRQAWW